MCESMYSCNIYGDLGAYGAAGPFRLRTAVSELSESVRIGTRGMA
jgi:hypothetical protein